MWHEARKQERKIRGMLVDYRKRAERRRDFYEKIKADPTQFLQVHGRQSKVFLDPAIAAAADSATTMVPWQGNQDNLIDRFDVRAHLDFIVPIPHLDDEDPSLEDRQLNYERYRIVAQNSFLQIGEEKFLKQLHLEEQFGYTEQQEPKKKKTGGVAIGFNYEDGTGTSQPAPVNQQAENNEDSDNSDESDSDLDVDLSINVAKVDSAEAHEMNRHGRNFGMSTNDFYSFLTNDLEEAENFRLAKEEENEKALFAGRKSRRERRAHREKRLANRKISPPSYAAQVSPSAIVRDESKSPSHSPSPEVSEKITYITSFGGDDEPQMPLNPTYADKVKFGNKLKKFRRNDDSEDRLIFFEKKASGSSNRYGNRRRSSSRRRSRSFDRGARLVRPYHRHNNNTPRQKSRSSTSSSSHHSQSRSYSNRRRSRSRSPSRSSRSSQQHRHRQRYPPRRNHRNNSSSQSRSRSRNRSVSGGNKRGMNRSNSDNSDSNASSSGGDGVEGQKEEPRQLDKGREVEDAEEVCKDVAQVKQERMDSPSSKVVPRYYGRRRSDRSSSSELDVTSDGNGGDSKMEVDENSVSSPATQRNLSSGNASASAKVASSSGGVLSLQERLRRKRQALLNKQFKADKIAEQLKTEREKQEQQTREDELREMGIKLRRKQRERRHAYDSDNSSSSRSSSASSKSHNTNTNIPNPPSQTDLQSPAVSNPRVPKSRSKSPPSRHSSIHRDTVTSRRSNSRSRSTGNNRQINNNRRRSSNSPRDRDNRLMRSKDRDRDRGGRESSSRNSRTDKRRRSLSRSRRDGGGRSGRNDYYRDGGRNHSGRSLVDY